MSNAFILAAGKAERHNGGNKPLLKVGQETLLERMVRQIKSHVRTIWIVTHREDLQHPDCRLINPQNHDHICDTLYSSTLFWSLGERTLILLGDVYYTDNAIQTILSADHTAIAFGEGKHIHALSIPYQNAFWTMGELSEFRRLAWHEPLTYKHGKLHSLCDFARIKRIPLDKETTDIDSPQEHERLLERLKL